MCAGFPSPKGRSITDIPLQTQPNKKEEDTMFKTSTSGKIFATAVAADLVANKGRGTASMLPGCAIFSLLIFGLITAPIIWLIMKIFF